MSGRQKAVAVFSLTAMIMVLLFPPWEYVSGRTGTMRIPTTRAMVTSPPISQYGRAVIGMDRLAVELGGVAVVGAVAFAIVTPKRGQK